MGSHSIEQIRTIALVGQSGSGKTALAEALLAQAGAIPAPGSVERGSTVCDYTPLEKELQHSLKLAVASFDVKDAGETFCVHLLDTPGYADFVGHSLPALAAVETAAIVVNAQNGVEMMTNRFMHWAERQDALGAQEGKLKGAAYRAGAPASPSHRPSPRSSPRRA